MDETKKKTINCRICLRVDVKTPEKCLSLFEKYNASMVVDQIKYIADVKIRRGDGLPDKICLDCLLQLDTAVHFKQQCENSDKILNAEAPVEPLNICEVSLNDEDKYDEGNFSDVDCPEYSDHKPQQPAKKPKVKSKTEVCIKKSKPRDLKLICDDCGESFRSKCKLAVHWKKIHLQSKLICPNCKRMFKSYKAYHVHAKKQTRSCKVSTQVHIEGQGKTREFHCKECDYSTKRIKDMDAHLSTHTGDRRYQCTDCFKSFTQHSSLQSHREAHHQDFKIQTTCHFCGKFFLGRAKFYKHLRIHQARQVQCDYCKKMFKSRANLIVHMKRHTEIRSYNCEKCSANFYTPGELYNHHQRVHMKTKSFNCDLCQYKAFTSAILKTHRSKHTPLNVVCLDCGMFVEKEKIITHQKRHLEKNYLCPICAQTFFRKDSVQRHVRRKHSNLQSTPETKANSDSIKQENSYINKFENVIVLTSVSIS